jgi:2-polyprenyl-3-methyl-5-hydroxy-6-metoxy-1,4-benzoquinol methylase
LCNVRQVPFAPESFDVVLCGEVVEHMEKSDALALVKSMNAIARGQVIISAPVGQCEQHEYDSNPRQAHIIVVRVPQDFRRLGYTPAQIRPAGHGRFDIPRDFVPS